MADEAVTDLVVAATLQINRLGLISCVALLFALCHTLIFCVVSLQAPSIA